MKTYAVEARVETFIIRTTGHGTWNGYCEVPVFYVRARNEAEAEKTAGDIIDPLQMTGARIITVRRAKRKELREQ